MFVFFLTTTSFFKKLIELFLFTMKEKFPLLLMVLLMVAGSLVVASSLETRGDLGEIGVSDHNQVKDEISGSGEDLCIDDIDEAENYAEDRKDCRTERAFLQCPHSEDFVRTFSGCELDYLLDKDWKRNRERHPEFHELEILTAHPDSFIDGPGTGVHRLPEGEKIHLDKGKLPTGVSFERWVAEDTEIEKHLEENPEKAENTLVMPDRDLRLRAVFEQAPSPEKLEVEVETDSDTYEKGEEIDIRISAEGSQVLRFNSGCQATYRIYREESYGRRLEKVFDVSQNRMCTMQLTEARLPETWSFTHDLSTNELDAGRYLLKAGPAGYEKAEKRFRVGESEDNHEETEEEEIDHPGPGPRRVMNILDRLLS